MIENRNNHAASALSDILGSNLQGLGNCVDGELSVLVSQTTLPERYALYRFVKDVYSGEGDILDIGCAAGGSTYCLAAGLRDNSRDFTAEKDGRVIGIDKFDGYSCNVFPEYRGKGLDDLQIFDSQISCVSRFVTPLQADLLGPDLLGRVTDSIEVAHIDAAKSLELWHSIFSLIAPRVIPGKTIWIYQDFERCRLPFQVYTLKSLLGCAEIIGGAALSTIYIRFNEQVPYDVFVRIMGDSYSLDERLASIHEIYPLLFEAYPHLFYTDRALMGDIMNTAAAYCYLYDQHKDRAISCAMKTRHEFFELPGNEVYKREIGL
jgi:hypothetical protein